MSELLEIVAAILPSVPSSAPRLFGEWVVPQERRFDFMVRPVACSLEGRILTLKLDWMGELLIDSASDVTSSPGAFRIGVARHVRLNATIAPGGPGTPSRSYFIEYRVLGATVSRRDELSWRSFQYDPETAAVEFLWSSPTP